VDGEAASTALPGGVEPSMTTQRRSMRNFTIATVLYEAVAAARSRRHIGSFSVLRNSPGGLTLNARLHAQAVESIQASGLPAIAHSDYVDHVSALS
jgi:ClpP class serine protease